MFAAVGHVDITNAGTFQLSSGSSKAGVTHGLPHTNFAAAGPIGPKVPFAVEPAYNSKILLPWDRWDPESSGVVPFVHLEFGR